MAKFSVGSCFAGVGGFDLGLESTGNFETRWYSEVDRSCNLVMADQYPQASALGDIRALVDGLFAPPSVDVIVGGPPCQGITKANSYGRLGLADERSALFFEYAAVIEAVQPKWLVMEQVSSLLTIPGDYETVMSELENIGYAIASVVVNSLAYVPQTRERLIIVGNREPGAAARALLPLASDGARHPREGKPTRRRPPLPATSSTGIYRKSRRPASSTDSETWVAADYTNTLTVSDVGTARATVIVVDKLGRPRVMTPEEWEMAHGFPAGWTAAAQSDGARWRALGNAVSPPVAAKVGEGISNEEGVA